MKINHMKKVNYQPRVVFGLLILLCTVLFSFSFKAAEKVFVGDKTGTYKLDCSNTKIGSWEVISTTYLVYTPLNSIPEAEKVIQMTSIQFKSALAITLPNGQPATITKTWDRQ